LKHEHKRVTSINIPGYCVGKEVIKPDCDRLRPLQELPPPGNMKALTKVLSLFDYYAKRVPGFYDKIQRLKTHYLISFRRASFE